MSGKNPSVDFYILEEVGGLKSLHFACQLLEKEYQAESKIYVHMSSREDAERFDSLLWTYRDDSFLPHALATAPLEFPPAIQIGYGTTPPENLNGLLINLTNEIPVFYAQFEKVIEIVFSDPGIQQMARARFKQYRDNGCNMNTHKMAAYPSN